MGAMECRGLILSASARMFLSVEDTTVNPSMPDTLSGLSFHTCLTHFDTQASEAHLMALAFANGITHTCV